MDELLNYFWLAKRIDVIKDRALTESDILKIVKFYKLADEILLNIFKSEWIMNFGINVLSHHTKIMIIFLYNKVDEGNIELEEKLKKSLVSALKTEKWSLLVFLTLAIGFLLLEKLKKGKYCESIWPHYEPRRSVKIPFSAAEIGNIKKELIHYFKNKTELLNQFVKNNTITEVALPINWLELVQKTKGKSIGTFDNSEAILSNDNIVIAAEMAQPIRDAFYNIDQEKVEDGIFPVIKYNAKEAADVLGISLDQFITECFESDFGVYIKKGDFKVRQYLHSPVIREEINAQSKPGYVYAYRGLLRLEKKSKMYPNATLEKIYEGSSIKVDNSSHYRLVPLQVSLAECVRGISLCIELRGKQKISLEDLVFIKDEIDAYAIKRREVQRTESKELSQDKKQQIWDEVFTKTHELSISIQQGNTMQLVASAISLILNTVKMLDAGFDPMQMPGTVDDFHKFCLSIPNGEKIFPNKKESFRKYCRGTIQHKLKTIPLCGWSNPPVPNSEFWQSLKPNVKSYMVNQMAFN